MAMLEAEPWLCKKLATWYLGDQFGDDEEERIKVELCKTACYFCFY